MRKIAASIVLGLVSVTSGDQIAMVEAAMEGLAKVKEMKTMYIQVLKRYSAQQR